MTLITLDRRTLQKPHIQKRIIHRFAVSPGTPEITGFLRWNLNTGEMSYDCLFEFCIFCFLLIEDFVVCILCCQAKKITTEIYNIGWRTADQENEWRSAVLVCVLHSSEAATCEHNHLHNHETHCMFI